MSQRKVEKVKNKVVVAVVVVEKQENPSKVSHLEILLNSLFEINLKMKVLKKIHQKKVNNPV
jgi:hypothetical protein